MANTGHTGKASVGPREEEQGKFRLEKVKEREGKPTAKGGDKTCKLRAPC